MCDVEPDGPPEETYPLLRGTYRGIRKVFRAFEFLGCAAYTLYTLGLAARFVYEVVVRYLHHSGIPLPSERTVLLEGAAFSALGIWFLIRRKQKRRWYRPSRRPPPRSSL